MTKLQARSKPQQERSRKRVNLILDTAEQLVMEKGFESVTAQMISQETNISPGVIYHYFPGKHGIFAAVADRTFRNLETRMSDIYAKASADMPFESLIDEIVDDLVRYWRSHKAAILMWQAQEHSPRMDPVTKVLKKKGIQRNAELLRVYFPSLSKARINTKAMIMEEVSFCLLRQTIINNRNEAARIVEELKCILKNLMVECAD
ncbi:MAG: TetR/AcrR family transcriptional regulator [Halioglobus sp.]|nr:TetR/AcrR family transcriptional regulator [Halioglobus sp.]